MKTALKSLLIISLACFGTLTTAKTKHRNTVKIYLSNYFYPGVTNRSNVLGSISPGLYFKHWGQIGFGYERYVTQKISVEVAYSRWNNTNYFRGADTRKAVFSNFHNRPADIGFHSRGNLQFYDLNCSYTFLSVKKHRIKGGVAVSFQTGHTGYIDSIQFYNGASFPHFQGYEHYEYEEYWGYAPSLSYDFVLLKGWAKVGADLRARRYFNYGNYTQVDIGIHIGVNF